MQYKFLVSGSAPILYPTDTYFGLLYYNNRYALEIPKCHPFKGEWGKPLSSHLLEQEDYPIPIRLEIVWLSLVERKFYSITHHISANKYKIAFNFLNSIESNQYFYIVVGMAPLGKVAIWVYGDKKAILIEWLQAENTSLPMSDFIPTNPELSLDEVCDFYLEQDPSISKNIELNGLPPRQLFDKYMQQFSYRYLPLFEHWDEDKGEWQKYEEEEEILPEFEYIEEALFDGTHDKLHDGGLMNYHEAGKPKKLAVKWHVKKSDFTAYYWFEDEEICRIYDRFYGAHPDTKTDFIIRIDSENNKYELALYRYGLKEPLVISESAYQLIVFKDKFECFRSENYDQPTGAWIW